VKIFLVKIYIGIAINVYNFLFRLSYWRMCERIRFQFLGKVYPLCYNVIKKVINKPKHLAINYLK